MISRKWHVKKNQIKKRVVYNKWDGPNMILTIVTFNGADPTVSKFMGLFNNVVSSNYIDIDINEYWVPWFVAIKDGGCIK